MAFPDGWGRKQEITIDNTQVSGTGSHTDFPTLITLDHLDSEIVDAGSNSALNGGGDLRFSTDSAGTTRLDCEIVAFITNATAGTRRCTVWVKVSSLSTSADTTIYIWYKKTGETQPAASAAFGSEAVWSDYQVVVHSDGSDSTGNITFTQQGSPTGVTGPFNDSGGADDYGSHSQNYGWTGTISNYQTFTLQAWAQPNGSLGDDIGLVSILTNGGFSNYVSLFQNDSPSDWVSFSTNDGEGVSGGSPSIGTWELIHVVMDDGVGSELFENGTSISSSGTMDNAATGKTTYSLGYTGFGVQNFDGLLAEHRLRTTTLSSGWVDTEFNNQDAPATFATAGTPEDATSAGRIMSSLAGGGGMAGLGGIAGGGGGLAN